MKKILDASHDFDFALSSAEPMRNRKGRDSANARDRGTSREMIRNARKPRSGFTAKRAGLVLASSADKAM